MAGAGKFFQAYLVAYVFWVGIVLGSMALLMVQHLSGGAWGVVIRRPLEAAVRTMPIMACCSSRSSSGWDTSITGRTPKRRQRSVMREKAAYFNTPFFHRPPGLLFRHLDGDRAAADAVVGRAGSHRRPRAGPQVLGALGRRPRHLLPDRHLRHGRLDDVGQPALVLDHVGAALHVGQGLSALAFAIIIVDHAVAVAPLNRVVTSAPPARSRQAAVRVPDDVGVSVVLAVPDHLVGEPRRRDPALPVRWDGGWQYVSASSRRLHFACPTRCCCRATSSAISRACGSWRRGFCWRAWWTTTGTWRRSSTASALSLSLLDIGAADSDRRHLPGVLCDEPTRPFAVAGEDPGWPKAWRITCTEADGPKNEERRTIDT